MINKRGFIATISVVILAFAIVSLVIVVDNAMNSYIDNVYLYELRFYVRQDIKSCLSVTENMLAHDFFLRGIVNMLANNCVVFIENNIAQNMPNSVLLHVSVKINQVVMKVDETIVLENLDLKVVERIVNY